MHVMFLGHNSVPSLAMEQALSSTRLRSWKRLNSSVCTRPGLDTFHWLKDWFVTASTGVIRMQCKYVNRILAGREYRKRFLHYVNIGNVGIRLQVPRVLPVVFVVQRGLDFAVGVHKFVPVAVCSVFHNF